MKISFVPSLLILSVSLTALIVVDSYNIHNIPVAKSRRSFFGDALVGAFATTLVLPSAVRAEEESASIARFPPIQYLFPIYNFQESLDYIGEQLNANTEEGIRRASESVDQFLSGGFLSNKNLFKSLCTIYIGEIKYTPGADKKVVQDAFLADCDQIAEGMVQLQKPLQALVKEGASEPTPEVLGYLKDSQTGLQQFLGRIPKEDVVNLRGLIQKFKEADFNQNGKLDRNEVNSFTDQELEAYKTIGDLIFKAKS